MEEHKFINEEGMIGTGEGLINTNSQEFQVLRQKIVEASKKRDPIARIEDHLLGLRFRMERYVREGLEKEVIPVGTFLKECIQAMKIKNKDFAAYIGYEESNLSALCHGRRKLTPELALKLARIVRIPAELWLAIQNREELARLDQQKQADWEHLDLRDLIRKSA